MAELPVDNPIEWLLREIRTGIQSATTPQPVNGLLDFIPAFGEDTQRKRVAVGLSQLNSTVPTANPNPNPTPGGGFRVDVKLDASRIRDLRPPEDGKPVTYRGKIKPASVSSATRKKAKMQKRYANSKSASQGY